MGGGSTLRDPLEAWRSTHPEAASLELPQDTGRWCTKAQQKHQPEGCLPNSLQTGHHSSECSIRPESEMFVWHWIHNRMNACVREPRYIRGADPLPWLPWIGCKPMLPVPIIWLLFPCRFSSPKGGPLLSVYSARVSLSNKLQLLPESWAPVPRSWWVKEAAASSQQWLIPISRGSGAALTPRQWDPCGAQRPHLAAAWFSLTQLGMGVNRCTSLAELELRPQVKVWAAPPGQPLTQAERVAENQDIRMGGGGGKQWAPVVALRPGHPQGLSFAAPTSLFCLSLGRKE